MVDIGLFQYAPDFVQTIAKMNKLKPTAFAFFRRYPEYENRKKKDNVFRNKTTEMIGAVRGIVSIVDPKQTNVAVMEFQGNELRKLGWDVAGAAASTVAHYVVIFGGDL